MPDVGLEQIETNTLARLRNNWPATAAPIVEFDITAEPENIVCPGIYVAAECTGFKRIAHDEYKKLVTVHVYLIVSNLQGPSFRRKAAHPLVLAMEQLLIGQKLSLEISPLVPVRSPEITDAKLRAALKIGFRIDLSTSYGITAATEAETTELLKIIAQYYLKPESPAEEDVAEWEASTSYNADAIVRPTVPNGHVYIASVDVEAGHGSSGTTEPTWPTDDDDTVTDNEVVWTENGAPPEDAEDEIDLS